MPLRKRFLLELVTLAILTVVFLVLFPERPTYVDALLALFALSLIAWNVRFTRDVVWGQFPVELDSPTRLRRSSLWVAAATAPAVLAFLATGLALGHSESGWADAWERVANWHLLIALALYAPWALLQQFLFQFYLLGRLLTLLPPALAVVITGLCYSLVHLPDLPVTAVTALAGVFWTALYRRHRVLTPLALSHAVLGSTFYTWVYGQDLFAGWSEAVR